MAEASIQHKILLVDDDVDLLALLNKILSDNGYLVDIAHNGAQAKYKIETGLYDLVITDMNMPLLGGAEFIKLIHIHYHERSSPPIIAISGHLSDDIKQSLQESGVKRIFRKPINYQELLLTISEIL